MKIIGIEVGTSYTINNNTRTFVINGLRTGFNLKNGVIRNVELQKSGVSYPIVFPGQNEWIATEIDTTGNYIFDYSSYTTAPVVATGDKLVIKYIDSSDQSIITNTINLIKIGVDAISDNRVTYTYNITTNFGNVATFFPTVNGIVSQITGVTIQQVTKNNVVQSLPFIVDVGDTVKVVYVESPPRVVSFVISLVSRQFSSVQNSNYLPSRELYGVTFGIVSSTLNNTLLLARQGGSVLFNSNLLTEKVISSVDLIGGYNFSSLSTGYPFWEKSNILEIGKYLFFTGLTTTALYRYDQLLKTLNTVISKTSIRNFIKVQTSGGIINIYVATATGLWKYNPETGLETLIDSTAVNSVFWHPSLNKIYAFVAGFCRVYNPNNDSLITTITLQNTSTFAFVQYSQVSNRLLALNPIQIGSNILTIINTRTDTVEANRSIGNIMGSTSELMIANNHYYFGNSTGSSIAYLNISTLPASVSSISMPAGPYYLLAHGNYLYVSCYTTNKVVVINNNQIVNRLEVEPGPGFIFYDSIRNLIVVLCQAGNSIHEIIPY